VAEMEQGSATVDGKIDFPEFLKWWKSSGSKRKKGSIAEKIAARKKAEQEAAAREAEDLAREKEERAARAKEQSEARKKKAAAKAEAEAERLAAEEAEAAAAEEAEKRDKEEKAARWKERARRERCEMRHSTAMLFVQTLCVTDAPNHTSKSLNEVAECAALHCLRADSEEAEAAKLAEEEEEARREAEFQELKRKKMEELEKQLALVCTGLHTT
jgi:hypothetical protein